MSTETRQRGAPTTLQRVVGVVVDAQTYRNLAYLLLSFPLGILYFAVLVTGFGLGIGLSITLVGVPIFLATLSLARILAEGERRVADALLGTDIERPPRLERGDVWTTVRNLVTEASTWTATLFLFVKFVLGVAAFTVVGTLGSLSLAFLGAPLYFDEPGTTIGVVGGTQIDTLPEAFGLAVFGALMLLASLHVFNLTARVSGWVAESLLSPVD